MKIVLEDLTKKFPNRDRKKEDVTAVDHFSFEIPDGELVSLLGPSGCGKSTTLNMICGLEEPTEGRIFFGEEEVTSLPPEKRGVGMVFQSYALYPHLSVRKNILFPLQNQKGKERLSKEEMNRRVEKAAQLVQITPYLERRPRELSGGQQQRVAIARALVKMPRVLLLDEPLSNLDARLRLQTRAEIRRIQQETGITTVFVTHDQEEAMSISDRMVVMKDGILQQIGKPQEIYDNPVNLFVAQFLGNPPINLLEGTIRNGEVLAGNDVICRMPAGSAQNKSGGHTAGHSGGQAGRQTDGQKVIIGIRPEGFVLQENGPLSCRLRSIEVMGRDTSIVMEHDGMTGNGIRAIVPGDGSFSARDGLLSFAVRPGKLFLFDPETGSRIGRRDGAENRPGKAEGESR